MSDDLCCMFCGMPLGDNEIVSDDNEGVACRECAAVEIAAQRLENDLHKPINDK